MDVENSNRDCRGRRGLEEEKGEGVGVGIGCIVCVRKEWMEVGQLGIR